HILRFDGCNENFRRVWGCLRRLARTSRGEGETYQKRSENRKLFHHLIIADRELRCRVQMPTHGRPKLLIFVTTSRGMLKRSENACVRSDTFHKVLPASRDLPNAHRVSKRM